MKAENSYIIDHLSVLMVKKDFDKKVDKELTMYGQEFAEMLERNPIIANDLNYLLGQMYAYNKLMYPIHDELMGTEGQNGLLDDASFRALTEQLLTLNAHRVKARSEVAKLFNEFEEYKTYAEV